MKERFQVDDDAGDRWEVGDADIKVERDKNA